MGWITSTDVTPTEILASDHIVVRSITIASGAGVLNKGQVVGQYATGVNSGNFAAYDNSVSNGLQVATGILADKVDATASGAQGAMYVHGFIYEESTFGLDASAKTDLTDITFIHNA